MMTTLISGTLLPFLLLLISAPVSSATFKITAHESFLQCFLHSPNTSSHLVYTTNSTSFNTVFLSNVQNIRFLSSNNTKPTIIITPTNPSHVQASVFCSKKHGLLIRTRSGGHDYEGLSYVSDGDDPFIIIDLVNLRSITVDTETGTAWVGAGATLGEVYYRIAEKSNTSGFPAGICPTVGVGGHFSGGGFATMVRKYGTAADNVIDAQLVDANGNYLNRESMGEDLFWAIRGGGAASFGIILSYKINLVYVPSKVTVFTINKTLKQNATKLVNRWEHIADKFDTNLFIRILAQAIADEESKGNRTINAAFECLFLGGNKELLTYMENNFPELGVEPKDLMELTWIESVKYFAGYINESTKILLDRTPEFNSSFKAKSDFVKEPISENDWEKIWKFLIDGKDEQVVMIMDPFGGRMDDISESSIPFPHRKGNLYNIQYFMRWFERESAISQRHLEWMRKLYNFMAPYVSKNPRVAYLNYKDIDLGRNEPGKMSYLKARVWGRKYFRNNFKRLATVKSKVDPGNFFRNEQSIPPLLAW